MELSEKAERLTRIVNDPAFVSMMDELRQRYLRALEAAGVSEIEVIVELKNRINVLKDVQKEIARVIGNNLVNMSRAEH